jgi:hypothetical protein
MLILDAHVMHPDVLNLGKIQVFSGESAQSLTVLSTLMSTSETCIKIPVTSPVGDLNANGS